MFQVKVSSFVSPNCMNKTKSHSGKEEQDDFGHHLAISVLADEVSAVSAPNSIEGRDPA